MHDIYVFIDSQNLNLAIKDCGWKLDFKKFYIYLKDKYKIKMAFIFIGFIKENLKMYSFLRLIGYILIFKPTVISNISGCLKGNVDAELVLHSMIQYGNYEKAIIISGDGDFFCLVEYLQRNNKLFKIMVPSRKNYSSLLRKFMNYIDFVDSLQNKIAYKKPC